MNDYIALYHATGKLWMYHEDGEYTCEFTDLDNPEKDILEISANSLSMKNRFSGMFKKPFSVLRHSYLVGQCLHNDFEASPLEALIGYMHDIGEAFYADIPRPFKTEEDRKKERAILQAMPWKFLHDEMPVIVKKWDNVALYCEATEYGHSGWEWPNIFKNFLEITDKDISSYKKMMNLYSKVKEHAFKDNWIEMVSRMIGENA